MFKKHKKILSSLFLTIIFVGVFASPLFFSPTITMAQDTNTSSTNEYGLGPWENGYYQGWFGKSNTYMYIPVLSELSTQAGDVVTDILGWSIKEAFRGLMYVLALIAGLLFWIGAQLIGFFMSLNMAIFEMPLVEVGWKIVRDIANLGFVLAIIIIAVATIVRYEEYGTKKLLPKLIAAAILVNFSLTIGAVFVDFSNTLTNFFISRSSKGGDVIGMTTELAAGFDTQNFLRTKADTEGNKFIQGGKDLEAIGAIISLSMAALFTFISAVSLLGIAIMLLMRFMYLSVLLLVSPIIYLFWVIPDTQSVWKSWWHSFMKWVFNAPILTSFLYLTVTSVTALGKFSKNYAETAGSKINDSLSLTPEILIVIGNSLVMTGLLVAGLITANNLGIAGATTAYNLASKTGKAAKGWAASKSKNAAKKAGRSVATAGTKTDEQGNTTTALERFGGKYGKIPLIGRAITGISGISSSARAASGKGVEERMKGLENRTGDDLVALASRKGISSEELAATGIAAAKKGKWNDLSEETRKSVVDAARKTKTGDKLAEQAPWLAKELGEDETKLAAKMNEVPKSAIYGKKNPDGTVMKGADGKPVKEIDPNYEKFVQDNAINFPTQFKEELGKLPKDTGQAVRDAFESGLINAAKNIKVPIINAYDMDKKEWTSTTKAEGYEGLEEIKKQVQSMKGEITPLDSEIDEMREHIDKPKLAELKKQQIKYVEEKTKLEEELRVVLSASTVDPNKSAEIKKKIKKIEDDDAKNNPEIQKLEELHTKFDGTLKKRTMIQKQIKAQTDAIRDATKEFEREEARAVSRLDNVVEDPSFKRKKKTP